MCVFVNNYLTGGGRKKLLVLTTQDCFLCNQGNPFLQPHTEYSYFLKIYLPIFKTKDVVVVSWIQSQSIHVRSFFPLRRGKQHGESSLRHLVIYNVTLGQNKIFLSTFSIDRKCFKALYFVCIGSASRGLSKRSPTSALESRLLSHYCWVIAVFLLLFMIIHFVYIYKSYTWSM